MMENPLMTSGETDDDGLVIGGFGIGDDDEDDDGVNGVIYGGDDGAIQNQILVPPMEEKTPQSRFEAPPNSKSNSNSNSNSNISIDEKCPSPIPTRARPLHADEKTATIPKDLHPLLTAPPALQETTPILSDSIEPKPKKMSSLLDKTGFSMPSFAPSHAGITSALNSLTSRIQAATVSQPAGVAALPPTSSPMQHRSADTNMGSVHTQVTSAIGPFLEGEQMIMFLSNLREVKTSSESFPVHNIGRWSAAMTFYRFILFTSPPKQPNGTIISDQEIAPHISSKSLSLQWQISSRKKYIIHEIPLGSIDKVEKADDGITIKITAKDFGRQVIFSAQSIQDCRRAHEALQTYAFPGRRNLGYLFAFEARRAEVLSNQIKTDKYKRFSLMTEYERMLGNISACWRTTDANYDYGLCGSYPRFLVLTKQAVDEGPSTMKQLAMFRSEGRLPALSWGCHKDAASIWRCSQPKVGLQGNRSFADERHLRQIAEAATTFPGPNKYPPRYLEMLTGGNVDIDLKQKCMKIFDLRPKSSAMANRTTGHGYENTSHYPFASLEFMGISNIHSVRDSYQKLSALCLSPAANDIYWNALVEDTKWITLLRHVLNASWQTAFYVHIQRIPVLLHCSHGWDRTSQVSALAQLFIDPFTRTFQGFSALVEKDFLSFGHPFHLRSAHGEGRFDRNGNGTSNFENQVSPIFFQFLDCAWQIVNQFPDYFEFSHKYLLVLSENVFSCRFGTLLCDTEREREVDANIRQRTHSLWEHLEQNRDYLKNVNYDSTLDVLLPPLPTLLRGVVLWEDAFLRYGPKASAPCMDESLVNFTDWGKADKEDDATGIEMGIVTRQEKMELYGMKDEIQASLRKIQAEADHWKNVAQLKENELEVMKLKSSP